MENPTSRRDESPGPAPRPADQAVCPVLSLDQIKTVKVSNDYTEGPGGSGRVAGHSTSPHKGEQRGLAVTPGRLDRSTSTGSTASKSSSARTSISSTSSEQRLLLGPTPVQNVGPKPKVSPGDVVRIQPRCCGRCRCTRCASPRALPTCWLCEKRCLCSASAALEYATCLCCVQALFYHCSQTDVGDSGDSWADNPCSCRRAHCALRWGCLGLLSLAMPCLLCYPPGRAALNLCQTVYDRATRPGCRCRDSAAVERKVVEPPRHSFFLPG
uniref:Sprouty RTK signaling antagonist 2 n=1 Tax=Eptatretus burgeri TaxID=7764 RepID=A0A8C4R4L9_EPTBU